MNTIRVFLLSTLFMLACAKSTPQPKAAKGESSALAVKNNGSVPLVQADPSIEVTSDFLPVELDLQCPADDCPPQVGLLGFMEPASQRKDHQSLLHRCTGTLIASDLVLSNGHCDFLPLEGFFLIGSGKNRQIRKVESVVSKRYTPGEDRSLENAAPDVAIFKLSEPMKRIKPLTIVSGEQLNYDSLTAFVVNYTGKNEETGAYVLTVDRIECLVRRHERIFPFDISESPDILWGFDCRAEVGNSGAPLFAQGSSKVQALLQGVSHIDLQAENAIAKEHRKPEAFDQHDLILATNLRCLTAKDCLNITADLTRDRFEKAIQSALPQTVQESANLPFQFEVFHYEFLADINSVEKHFEMVFSPVCRTEDVDLKEVKFLNEKIHIVYDEWANPTAEVSQSRLVPAPVEHRQLDSFTVRTSWPKKFAPLFGDGGYPNQDRGHRFSIELPLCPR